MMPVLDIQFDQQELQRLVSSLEATRDSCGLTVQWLVWDSARQAANNCIKYTAPWAGGSSPGNTAKQRNTGEAAVTHDLVGKKGDAESSRRGLFGRYTPEMKIYQEFNGGAELPNYNLIRLTSGAVYLVDKNVSMESAGASELRAVHLAHRMKNGRVTTAGRKDSKNGRWKVKNKYFAQQSVLEAYVKSVKGRVGKLKAGWLVAARHFAAKTGGRVASSKWIDRHGDLGRQTDSVARDGNGQAEMTNDVGHEMSIRPSFKPFIERLTNTYISRHLEKRIDQVCARFQKQQAKAEAVTS